METFNLADRPAVRALGYRRLSTFERGESGLALDVQLAALNGEAARQGWQLEVTTDSGWSTQALNRHALAEALTRLDAGGAELLIVSRLDRLAHSVLEAGALLERAHRRSWSVVCLDLGLDTSTPTGQILSSILVATAAYERTQRAAGFRPGNRSTLPTAVRERIAAARAAGQSYARIAAGLDADDVATGQGGSHWYPSTVRSVLLSEPPPTRPVGKPRRNH